MFPGFLQYFSDTPVSSNMTGKMDHRNQWFPFHKTSIQFRDFPARPCLIKPEAKSPKIPFNHHSTTIFLWCSYGFPIVLAHLSTGETSHPVSPLFPGPNGGRHGAPFPAPWRSLGIVAARPPRAGGGAARPAEHLFFSGYLMHVSKI